MKHRYCQLCRQRRHADEVLAFPLSDSIHASIKRVCLHCVERINETRKQQVGTTAREVLMRGLETA